MAMQPRPIIVWFRQDLRLADNPALAEAAKIGPIIPLYVLDDETPGSWKPGGASRWWLHHSLQSLSADLGTRGSKLILRKGTAAAVIASVAAETNAQAVYWNRLYEPYAIARDAQIKAALAANMVSTRSFNASLLAEPWTVKTGNDSPYRVFTPFWRSLLRGAPSAHVADSTAIAIPDAARPRLKSRRVTLCLRSRAMGGSFGG